MSTAATCRYDVCSQPYLILRKKKVDQGGQCYKDNKMGILESWRGLSLKIRRTDNLTRDYSWSIRCTWVEKKKRKKLKIEIQNRSLPWISTYFIFAQWRVGESCGCAWPPPAGYPAMHVSVCIVKRNNETQVKRQERWDGRLHAYKTEISPSATL